MQGIAAFSRLLLLAGVLACLAAGPVYAVCTNPAGNEGDQFYNYDYHTWQFCNGTGWLAYGGGSACSPVSNYSPTAPSGSGYFVMSKTTYTGNLGGQLGADASCLTDLTTNTGWMGYSTANSNGQLIATKVHAFICGSAVCNNLVPLATYYFADANDAGHGGASFTTDSNGKGPSDSANWSASNYFGSTYTYWTNRDCSDSTSTLWSNNIMMPGADSCSGFTGSSWDAPAGTTGYTDTRRWNLATGSCGTTNWVACGTSLNLICYVNP